MGVKETGSEEGRGEVGEDVEDLRNLELDLRFIPSVLSSRLV